MEYFTHTLWDAFMNMCDGKMWYPFIVNSSFYTRQEQEFLVHGHNSHLAALIIYYESVSRGVFPRFNPPFVLVF